MRESIGILYAPHKHKRGEHPWDEDMFMRPDLLLQQPFRQEGFELEIACVTSLPTGRDELPQVRIIRHPVYDERGHLLTKDFEPGTIDEWAGVIDHWIANFEQPVLQPDGTMRQTAHGIGIEPDRAWNHKLVQAFGNDKARTNEVLESIGASLATYSVLEYDLLVAENGSDCKIIFKPLGGSMGRGIELFNGAAEVRKALDEGQLAVNGLIQRFRDTHQPIQGLRGATALEDARLRQFNSVADRPREVRVHLVAWTDPYGTLHTEARPTLKYGRQGAKVMEDWDYIGLDPSCMPENSPMYKLGVAAANAICTQANVPQYYGAADFLVEGDINDPEAIVIGDKNCRGPHMPEVAYDFREIFGRVVVESAKRALI